ncbi:MAG TPA: FliA/WhiG family RNA polymerase sigma factor [Firmicutes bacterium]|jgi:RNA polymerase sigma factor for flagellar operon FliA|nr:FliA/WhiG family RNA polymerase sigma factor [Bacillota bacterium]
MSNKTAELNTQWQVYAETGNAAVRESLILAYAPLVKQMAGHLQMGLPAAVEIDDLVGYGMLGLLDAFSKYQPHMGVRFEHYAAMRIRGAMLDGLRQNDWAPRSLRRQGRRITQTLAELEAKLGRSATDQEIAAALEMSVAELHATLNDLRGLALLSLDQPLETEAGSGVLGDTIAHALEGEPGERYERQELLAELAAAIDALPERERLIVSLYYYEELTLKEIGAVLGISESRVCQLNTRAVLRLRAKLAAVSGVDRGEA